MQSNGSGSGGGLHFPHGKSDLIQALDDTESQPVTIAISKKKNNWIVSAALSRKIYASNEWNSDSFNGCYGIDFNEGFIEAVEIDGNGNMIDAFTYTFLHQGKNNGQALDEMHFFAKRMTLLAKSKHKDIWIENLDFSKKKAKTIQAVSKAGKKYNRMIHALSYSRFRECLEDACMREKVYLGTVNPAYTSKIGEAKFSGRMKITVHRAAAFVVARRGFGIWDKMPKRKKAVKAVKKKPKSKQAA